MVAKQKILIVDDDNNIAELIALYLTKECFETKIVNDGEMALKQFYQFHPDLILLDLMLPGMDGYQVCREIRHSSDVPIIMLSAKVETFDKVLGLELGADDYIIKPFDPKELIARVRAVLRRFQGKKSPSPSQEKNVSATRISPSISPTILSPTWETRWTCRQRSWSFSISLLHPPTRFSPESSFWTTSGDMNTSVTPARWTCTSNGSAKRSKTIPCGRWLPSGASAINSR